VTPAFVIGTARAASAATANNAFLLALHFKPIRLLILASIRSLVLAPARW
jgi:hypothetical protein